MGSNSKKKHKKHKNKDRYREMKKSHRKMSESTSTLNMISSSLNSQIPNSYSTPNQPYHQEGWNPQQSSANNTTSQQTIPIPNNNEQQSFTDNDLDITSTNSNKYHSHLHHHHHNNHWNNQIVQNESFSDSLGVQSIISPAGVDQPSSILLSESSPTNINQTKDYSPIKKLESSPVPNQPLRIVLKVHSGSALSISSTSNSSVQQVSPKYTTATNNTGSMIDSGDFYNTSDVTFASSTSDSLQYPLMDNNRYIALPQLQQPSTISNMAMISDESYLTNNSSQQQSQETSATQLSKSLSSGSSKKLKKSKKSKKSKHKKHSHHHHHHHHHCKKHQHGNSGTNNNNNSKNNSAISSMTPNNSSNVQSIEQQQLIFNQPSPNIQTSGIIDNESPGEDNFQIMIDKTNNQTSTGTQQQPQKDFGIMEQQISNLQTTQTKTLRLKLPKPSKTSNQYSKIPKILISEQSSPPAASSNIELNNISLDSVSKHHSSKSSSLTSTSKKEEKSYLKQLLMYLLKQLQRKDQQNFFAQPVSDTIAPGYSSIIAHPMDLSTIKSKIPNEYRTLGDFKADVKLMCDNAMKYNRPETIYYKAANKLWHYTKNKLFKKDSVLDYSKKYPKLTPLELSLMPSNQVMMGLVPQINSNNQISNTNTTISNVNSNGQNQQFGLLSINVATGDSGDTLNTFQNFQSLTPTNTHINTGIQNQQLDLFEPNLQISSNFVSPSSSYISSSNNLAKDNSNNLFLSPNTTGHSLSFPSITSTSNQSNQKIGCASSSYQFGSISPLVSNSPNHHYPPNLMFYQSTSNSYINTDTLNKSYENNYISGTKSNISQQLSPVHRNSNEELFDGLKANELIESVKQAAKQAQERLWATGRQHYLSYLEETKDQEVLLHSIHCQPPSLSSSLWTMSNSHQQQQRIVNRISFDQIYKPTENGRVDVNLLTTSSPGTQTNSTTNTSTISLSTSLVSNTTTGNNCNKSEAESSISTNLNNSKSELNIQDQEDVSNGKINDEDHSTEQQKDDKEQSKQQPEVKEKERIIKDLIEELSPCYGNEEFGINYALSIAKFARNSEYTFSLVTSLLSVLTDGEHRSMASKFHKLMQEQFDDLHNHHQNHTNNHHHGKLENFS